MIVIADMSYSESESGAAVELSVKYVDIVGHALTPSETEWIDRFFVEDRLLSG